MSFAEYVNHGWALCEIRPGTKAPSGEAWNIPERAIRDPARAAKLIAAGLCHAWSKTCSIDVDDFTIAREWLAAKGIDLDKLILAPESVQIVSGKVNRAKLLYKLDKPMPSVSLAPYEKMSVKTGKVQTFHAFELRCATRDGRTAQCVMPGTIHPETKKPYIWAYGDETFGHWSCLPPLPTAVMALWESLQVSFPPLHLRTPPEPKGASTTEIAKLLEHVNPDSDYGDWLKVGMALHHETKGSDEGFHLWNNWSAPGVKYKGPTDLRSHWNSFNPNADNPVTLGTLRRQQVAAPEDFLVVPHVVDRGRPIVQLKGGELHNYAAQCEAMLKGEIYVRDRVLVRVGGVPEMVADRLDEVRRDGAQAVIIPVGAEYLRRRLSQLARFEVYRRREKAWVPTDCPKDLVLNIAGQGDWPALPRLEAIARAPFVRVNGTICESPGYDSESLVFYAPNGVFPPVPANPTRADAEAALATLMEPFSEFPFASEEARSAFLANIITEAVRPALDASPLFCYTAPSPGTGKTLLSEMPSRIVHGCGPSLRPWTEGEELRKNLFASLLAGDRTIGYDNVPNGHKIRSPHLCIFLTADIYSDRKLGVSEVPSLPNRSVVFLTGNNITPAGDLARRSIVVRLDANSERLSGRRFRITDLKGYVVANRPILLVAALTLVRAYVAAGQPVGAVPLPSFERWSKLVRNTLIWLAMADPVATQLAETDDEAAPLAEAFRLIGECSAIGEREFAASELALACLVSGDARLTAAIEGAGCSAPTDAARIGYWLRDKRDRIAGGWKLERPRTASGVSIWRMRRVAP